MNKWIIFLTALIITGFINCKPNTDENVNPNNSFRLDEYQSNWQKRIINNRPNSNLPGTLIGMFARINTAILMQDNDSIIIYTNRYLLSENCFFYLSQDKGLSWSQHGSFNGILIDAEQINSDTSYVLRDYLGSIEFGKSYNQGLSWSWTSIPGNPYSICFNNADSGYALGDNGIYRSSNAGSSWSNVNSDSLSCIFSLNDTCLLGISNYEILKSSDRGESWTVKHTAGFMQTSISQSAEGVLYAGGYSGSILHSFDNGESWVQCFQLGQIYTGVQNAVLHKINMIDSLNGFAVLSLAPYVNTGVHFEYNIGIILRTPDAGETWSVNYRSEFIKYMDIAVTSGPVIMTFGIQEEDNVIQGIYVTRTQTLGN